MKVLFLLFLCTKPLQGLELCSTETENICTKSEEYDKYLNPDYPHPTPVQIDIVMRSILSIDENSQLLEMVAYSNLRWLDTRLDLNSTTKRIKLAKEDVKNLWSTSIHFSNVVTNTNRGNRVYAYKDLAGVWLEKVLLNKAVVSCRMNFSDFPFDSNVCYWKLRSFENKATTILNISSIRQETKDEVIASESQPVLVETTNLPYDIYVSPGPTGTEMVQREENTYVLVKFSITRSQNGRLQMISSYFLPTALFAHLSLVSYLIKPEIVPGRMGMLVILFLILVTIHGNVKGPSSRGFSYLELWYLGMFIPVIAAIIEYACLLVALKYKNERDYDSQMVMGKMTLRKFLAHVDMAFLCCNAVFLVVYIVSYFSAVPYH